jgi:hypothetical protein
MMFIPLKLPWVPFAEMAMMMLQGGSIKYGVIGAIAGQTVFFLLYLLPAEIGRPVLKTPKLLSNLLDKDIRRAAGRRF